MANCQTFVRLLAKWRVSAIPSDNHHPRFVSYLRVSTAKQGSSGLGIEAQRHAISQYLSRIPGAVLLQEFEEIESGKNNDRPKLREAISRVRLTGGTLVIGKLDRLSRSAAFLTGLAEKKIPFVACDMPDANEFTVTIMAALAQQERKMISERTKAALQAAKARGKRLGNPAGAAKIKHLGNGAAVRVIKNNANERAFHIKAELEAIQAEGHTTLTAIAAELDRRSITTPRGGKWEAKAVTRLLDRLAAHT